MQDSSINFSLIYEPGIGIPARYAGKGNFSAVFLPYPFDRSITPCSETGIVDFIPGIPDRFATRITRRQIKQ
jgi:hypothetical protein